MRIVHCAVALVASLLSTVASAQQFELPRPSPNARVMQTVGLTEITVDYSSPSVKGRKIWGGVVPFGEVWRAGANGATKIAFSKDVTINNTPVPAGSYAFFIIPAKASWTIILSKNAQQFGAFAYKKEDDFLRVEVKPQPVAMRERLQYSFGDFADQNKVSLELEWEKLRATLPIKLATAEQVEGNIKRMEESAWAPYNNAARYELEQGKNLVEGIALADKSIAIKETWFNSWTKAQLLAAKGDTKQARVLALRADELGMKLTGDDNYFYKAEVQKAISDWKSK